MVKEDNEREKSESSSSMTNSDISVLAQLLTAIKDAASKLEDAEKEKDAEKVTSAKREILNFQKQMDKML